EPAGESDAALAVRRVGEIVAGARAAELARYPDQIWAEERRRLADGFAPGTEAFDGMPGSGAAAVAAGDWLDAAGRYGRGGLPWAPAPHPEPTARDRVATTARAASKLPAETHDFLEAQAELQARAAANPSRRLVTVVAVEHDVTAVRLVGTSGSARHDRQALDRARRLQGLASAPRFRSCRVHWAFVTELFVSPPIPQVGVAFDAYFRPVKPDRPLRREARSRVELVAVWAAQG
ncbi:MAG TPA: hypothetical protein VLS93_09815, partial [Anaeromyxobacteraceae bacterium]|nr:hypothetical protein [Anaeromyxobacteraceae bacterium]